jgi:peptidyl-prolyl cis-trans isomerase C
MRLVATFLITVILLGCASTAPKPKEYQVSHIMCASESAANQALVRLQAGEPFEQVAREVSTDPGTRTKGGRITFWTPADSWSANFAAEVKRLKVGQTSDRPVKTEFGWHIVRVDATR